MSNLKRMLVLTAAGALLALVACAKAGEQTPATNLPCKADLEKFCAGIPEGGGKRYFCLEKNAAKLSPACRTQVERKRKRAAQHRAKTGSSGPCASDIQTLCKTVPSGGGRVLECLTKHESQLSSACKTSLAANKKK
jgi:hypothetical protein